MLIANRMIGTGIFATPASIVTSTGSIGLALILWVVGALIAGAGLAVYLVGSPPPVLRRRTDILLQEWASALPRSGGEKVYLEYAYRKPLYAITFTYAIYSALLGWPSGK
jgi:hypothetical protein